MAIGQKKQAQEKIDRRQFETLCGIQCTEEEICAVFDVSKDTLLRWCKRTYKKSFAEVFKEKKACGKVSLRRSQWKMAERNATMAIWLGKQYLGQKDVVEQKSDVKLNNGFIEALNAAVEEVEKCSGGSH